MKKNNQVPDWNRDKSWDKIEQRLEKKKRRFIPFWWIFGGVALALVGVVFLFSKIEDRKSDDQLDSELANQEINQNPHKQTELIADKKVENIEITSEPKIQKTVKGATSNNIETPNSIEVVEKSIENNSLALRFRRGKMNNSLSAADYQKHMIANAGISIPINTSRLAGPLQEYQNNEDIFEVALLNSLEASLNWEVQQLNLPTQMLVEIPVSEKNQPKIKANLIWFAESGFDFGNVNHTGENDYSSRRDATEDFRFTSTTTLGIEKEFSNKWFLKSGMTFQTIFEKYDTTAVSTNVEDVFRDSASYYELNDGQIYYEPGFVSETVTYRRRIVNNNFLYRLSLPITFGKKIQLGKTQLVIGAGLKPQFFQQFTGIFADENLLHLFDNKIINQNYYKNDFDLGFIGQAAARFSITPATQLEVGIRYEKDDFLGLRKETFMSRYEMVGGYFGVYNRF